MSSKLRALDCDGVLLDYDLGELSWLQKTNQSQFLPDATEFWETLPVLPGALEACHKLIDYGYELIAVTACPFVFEQARIKNLNDIGFPISKVYVTGYNHLINPKAKILNKLKPKIFVDDHLFFFEDLHDDIKTIHIYDGLPMWTHTHKSLFEYVEQNH